MSLKAFHVFFIFASIVLAFGFGVWAVYIYLQEGNIPYLTMGLLSIAAGVALVFYGIRFLQKMWHLR